MILFLKNVIKFKKEDEYVIFLLSKISLKYKVEEYDFFFKKVHQV